MNNINQNWQTSIRYVRTRQRLLFFAIVFYFNLIASLVWAASAPNATLEGVSFFPLTGNQVRIKLEFSDPVPRPSTFSIEKPPRIAFDFPNVSSMGQEKKKIIDVGVVESLLTLEGQGRMRIVLNLTDMVPYTTDSKDNVLTITLGGKQSLQNAGGHKIAFPGRPAYAGQERRLNNVDFRRTEDGAGRILFDLSDASTSIDVREEGKSIFVDFINTHLPEHLMRRLDVVDFGTPIQMIDTQRKGNGITVSITALGDYEQLAYQADQIFTIEVRPLSREEKVAKEKNKFIYTGQRLSLNFQDIEIRAVLQLIADFTGLNIVASDTVRGNVTLRLQNVPWDQALDIILKTKGLDKRKTGNVVMIAPSEEIAAREKLELQATQQVSDLAPLRSEFVQINYAKATDIADLLKSQEDTLLSKRGNVSVDNRTNTLLIQDTMAKIDEIRGLVNKLDVPVRQVLISARIVNATKNFERNLGIRWGAMGSAVERNNRIGFGGNLDAANSVATGAAPGAASSRLNVDLPLTGPTGTFGLAIAKLGSDTLLDLELQAAESETLANVIASPRLMTANQKEARIKQGKEIPFLESTSSGATSTSFKDAVLELRVTPQITPDNRVILDLIVTQDVPSDTFFNDNSEPVIDTKELETQVLVDNGETIVLGGIFERTKSDTVSKIPFFGDLPMVGALFRKKEKSDKRSELLIFVTPTIADEALERY